MELFFWVLLCALFYVILSSLKKEVLKRSSLKKDIVSGTTMYIKSFIEAVISTLGLVLAVRIVYAFTNTRIPYVFTFILGSFTCFYLIKIILFKIQQKQLSK